MSISAPPRPPSPARTAADSKPLEREEVEALVEALIEEARRETRRRHRGYWAVAALVTLVGVVVLYWFLGSVRAGSGPAVAPTCFSPRLFDQSLDERLDLLALERLSVVCRPRRRGRTRRGGNAHPSHRLMIELVSLVH